MPSRRIRDSICTSDNLNALSPYAENMFIRLIVNCDDFGRFDARPAVIKGKLFPLKSYDDQQIQSWLFELKNADLLVLYEVDGRPYLMIKSWEKYQYKRAKYSKFPPPSEIESCEQLCTDAHSCAQECANENECAQSCTNAPDIRYTNNKYDDDNDCKDTPIIIKDGVTKFTQKLESPQTAYAYLESIGLPMDDPYMLEDLRELLESGVRDDLINYAASRAKANNKLSWAYIQRTVLNWQEEGIQTVSQAKEDAKKHHENNRRNSKRVGDGPRTAYDLKPNII